MQLSDPSVLLREISEKQFQAQVRERAELLGWVVFTTWNSRHSPAGEPDLRLVHPVQKRIIWVELKTENGKVSAKQNEAIETLQEAGFEVFIWRPSDQDQIEKVLQGGKDK